MEIPQEKEENTIDLQCILLYKGLKGKASIPTDGLSHPLNPLPPPLPPPQKKKTRRGRNQYSMAFQTPIANTDVYKGSLPPPPTDYRGWNARPDSLNSFAEDAEDCIAKFTSLVRARN